MGRIFSWIAVCGVTAILLNSIGPLERWLSAEAPEDSHKQERNVQRGSHQRNEASSPDAAQGKVEAQNAKVADGDKAAEREQGDEPRHNESGVEQEEAEHSGPSEIQDPSAPNQPSDSRDKQNASVAQVVDKTELQRMYEELCAIHRERFSAPETGKHYRISFDNGRTLEGELIEVGDGHIRIRLDHGTIRIALHSLSSEDVPTFFPDRAAQIRALRDLKRTAKNLKKERRRGSPTSTGKDASTQREEPDPARTVSTDSSSPQAASKSDDAEKSSPDTGRAASSEEKAGRGSPASEREATGRGALTFDPSPTETSKELRPVLKAFAEWLEVQQRRVGGAIAQKAYAKKHKNGQVAVYLVTSPVFRKQDYTLKFQMAEGMWKFWGFRCRAKGVVSHPRNAYLVLVDDAHNVIGGSKPDQANNVWVAKKEDMPD